MLRIRTQRRVIFHFLSLNRMQPTKQQHTVEKLFVNNRRAYEPTHGRK
jgi:hypothetical protein